MHARVNQGGREGRKERRVEEKRSERGGREGYETWEERAEVGPFSCPPSPFPLHRHVDAWGGGLSVGETGGRGYGSGKLGKDSRREKQKRVLQERERQETVKDSIER